MPPPPTPCQAVLGKGTLHSLVGLCGLHKLKVLLSGPQEEAFIAVSSGTNRISLAGNIYSGIFPRTEVTY